jgi:hypothetical protein
MITLNITTPKTKNKNQKKKQKKQRIWAVLRETRENIYCTQVLTAIYNLEMRRLESVHSNV